MLKTEGIVLKEIKYGDTSKILNIYTRDLGKVSTIVKGAYNPKSKLIANSQTFSLNEYQFKKGRNFHYIIDADLLDSYYCLREDIERLIYGYYILELMDKSVPMEQENQLLYELLKKALGLLNTMEGDFLSFIIGYELKFASFLGYRPVLDSCVSCGEREMEAMRFSISQGGILCPKCFSKDGFSKVINREIYDIIYKALYSSLEDLRKIAGSDQDLTRAHNLLVDYILYSIDRQKFNSLALLETIV